eukprot:CAMPEP_0119027592 /NCGR_PEP_ID=MMETSP1176-20130426/37350_1 /TAXON_ID=265551 /ORGANISM="Synedropsis recta cf, Strain CCMP1620" /LENGTH=43 /DNA_ID= /DNA_START= /DNA_END= /DNA_ORIENTATION=
MTAATVTVTATTASSTGTEPCISSNSWPMPISTDQNDQADDDQ